MKENQNLLSALSRIERVEELLRSIEAPSVNVFDRFFDKIHLKQAIRFAQEAKRHLEAALAEKGGER